MTAWPEGVVARFVTRAAEVLHDPELTVDVSTTDTGAVSRCRGCGETGSHGTVGGARMSASRHAHYCRELPKPGVTP